MPSQHLEQIRVRATHPALYGLADKMRRVGKREEWRWKDSECKPTPDCPRCQTAFDESQFSVDIAFCHRCSVYYNWRGDGWVRDFYE